MIVMKRKLCWAINLSLANEASEPAMYTAMLIRSLHGGLILSDQAISWYSTKGQINACAWIDGGACLNPAPGHAAPISLRFSSRGAIRSLHRLWPTLIKLSKHDLHVFLASYFKNPEKPLFPPGYHFCLHCLQQFYKDDIEKSGVLYYSFMPFFSVFRWRSFSWSLLINFWSRVRYGKAERRWPNTRRIESGNSGTKNRRTRNEENIRRRTGSRDLVQTVHKSLIDIV